MRYWIASFVLAFAMISGADSQGTKQKDLGKDKKDKKDPIPKSMEFSDFQGRSFKEWQRDIKDKDPTRREIAIKSVLQFGAEKAYEAVPDILAELKKHNPRGQRVDLSVCVTGATALGTIFKFKRDPDPKDVKAAVSVLRTFMKDDQIMLRVTAVQNLPFMGPLCRDALPEVISLAREPSTWEARKEAMTVLGFIGFEDKGTPKIYVLGEIFKALDDHASQVRIAALRSTASLANKGEPPLKNQCYQKFRAAIEHDPDKHVVIAAHLAHMSLEGKATPAHLNPVMKLLKDQNPEIRMDALQCIGALGKEGSAAVTSVAECLDDPEPSVATGAVIVLATIDPDGSAPMLTRIKNSEKHSEAVRNAATEALAFRESMSKEKKKTDK